MLAWLAVTGVVIGLSVAIIVAIGMRPGYDAFGWLVWGHQVLHGSLNTDGAPSWKPVAFLFTLPYALAGDGAQMFLWMVTAIAAALAGCVFAARIAYRLVAPTPGRPYAPYVAGAFAGAGLLAIDGYSHLVLIASSDPMIATLCLAAIDFHLTKRPRMAFAMLVLASLGRPEAWPFAVLYAGWAWRAVPSIRPLAVGGLALIPAFWFTIPALTSKSWFISGDLALRTVNAVNVIHGSKLSGVVSRFTSLCSLPVQIAALVGVALAAVRRDLVTLGLAAAACLWVAVEFAMALHGWSAASRYLIEPAAVTVVIAGSAVGRVLALQPRARRDQRLVNVATAVASIVLVALLAAALIPTARQRARTARGDVEQARAAGTQIRQLQRVIAEDGGAARIRACGQPVTLVGLQSKVAWATGLNVGNVGFRPGHAIDSGEPIVFFQPHENGWRVLPFNMRKADAASCDRLKLDPS
ncbi:MAG: hypothetical protein ACLPTJ_17140 [Solirubrobacteraceae bacterium]